MSREKMYYQLSLALQADKHRQAVNLEALQDDLLGARDEFNCNLDDLSLTVLKPHMRRVHLLLKTDRPLNENNVLGYLQGFTETLIKDYNWAGYCDDRGALFSIKSLKPVDRETCKSMLTESRKKNAALFDRFESTLFFGEDIFQDDEKSTTLDYRIRLGFEDDSEMTRKPKLSLPETLRQLENLVGFDAVKEEVQVIVKMVEQLVSHVKEPIKGPVFPYHYLLNVGGPGIDLAPLLEVLAAAFYHLGLYEEYNQDELTIKEGGRNSLYLLDEEGLVVVHNVDILDKEDPEDFSGLLSHIQKNTGEAIYILTTVGREPEEIEAVAKKLEEKVNLRVLHVPDYTSAQLVQIAENNLQAYGIELEAGGARALQDFLEQARQQGKLENSRSAQKITEKLRFGKIQQLIKESGEYSTITEQDVLELTRELFGEEKPVQGTESAFDELERIIGLEEVKARVVEICRAIAVNKKKAELGIIEQRPNLHMLFKGNPGTGKTTFARIVARILKELGILSKGDFFEVTREDLVSVYLGGTAERAKRKIREAYGSVLFIDEAYALDGGHRRDYGHEALAVLVKEMEDKRDDLVVILAGYTEEIEAMLEINPGLKNRIAHQVEFPNYAGQELLQILEKELGEGYVLEQGAREMLLQLLENASRNADRYFGNGRFARTVAERLLAKQALRLGEQGLSSKEALQTLLVQDVEAVIRDQDIAAWHQREMEKKGIGF